MTEGFFGYIAAHQDQILANLGSAFLLIVLIGGLIWLLWFLDRSEDSEFKMVEIFKHQGMPSFWRVGNAFGLFTGTWLVITMELAGHTNEVIVGAYFLYCVGGYAVTAFGKPKEKEEKP
jgi:Ca2+/Na+ antiporter